MLFGRTAGILEQRHQAKKGRFDIGAFAKAKRLAKEEATATALSKCSDLQSIKKRCLELEDEIHAVKRKVCYFRLHG